MAHPLLGMFDELLNAFVLLHPHADLKALAPSSPTSSGAAYALNDRRIPKNKYFAAALIFAALSGWHVRPLLSSLTCRSNCHRSTRGPCRATSASYAYASATRSQ
jgi:hypothetical protein